MRIISDEGKVLGLINLIDLAVLLFIILIITTLVMYAYFPPQIKEHKEVILQIYFPEVPYTIGDQIFVEGNEFIATFKKEDKATIVSSKRLGLETSDNLITTKNAFQDFPADFGPVTNFIVTVNASLEVDVEGDYTFNDFNVGQGNLIHFQLNNSYLRGFIWRIDYDYYNTTKDVIIGLERTSINQEIPLKGDTVYDYLGNDIGHIVSMSAEGDYFYVTLNILLDIYDSEFYLNENPIHKFEEFTIITKKTDFNGFVIGVS